MCSVEGTSESSDLVRPQRSTHGIARERRLSLLGSPPFVANQRTWHEPMATATAIRAA